MKRLYSYIGIGIGLVFTIFLLAQQPAAAQPGYGVIGSAIDTVSASKMAGGTVYILNVRDSIIQRYTYVSQDGAFVVNDLEKGRYILLLTYPDYADYGETFVLDETNPRHDFGRIAMQLKSRLLNEVILKGNVRAIKLKGDTTEFNAKAYVIQPNDKVEDLLRQLPGLQVDKDGKITANGERVTKVLLDGEEFFGDDPTLVTKNIRADMVDKIQLYDKKSDQATFTGIDDGVKTKTINVKLREDKNSGIFGKLEAGTGSDDLYQAQGLYNHFRPGERYAGYATAANTGRVGLGQGDNSRLGTAGNIVPVGDVMIVPTGSADDLDGFNGTYNGRGLPSAATGGIHYDSKWKNGKDIFNANYKAGYLGVDGTNNLVSQQTLPSGILNSETDRRFGNSGFRQKVDAAFSFNPDSVSTLKIVGDAALKHSEASTSYLATTNRNTNLLNRNTQVQSSESDLRMYNLSALYTRRLQRSRTFSWALTSSLNEDQSDGYQRSTLDFYATNGSTDSTRIIDQHKTTELDIAVISSNMTFTLPLSKLWSAVFNYGIGLNNSRAERTTFNRSLSGNYDNLDATFSNNYTFNQLTNQFGSILNYKYGKSLLNLGTKLSIIDFDQENLNTGTTFRRNFLRWAPQLSYSLRISQQKNLSVNYNGNTIQPSLDQVQPVKVNNDPLNIILGNPGLQPSFSHRMNFRYRGFSAISGRAITLGGNYGFSPKAIVTSRSTSVTGNTTIQYVNLQDQTPQNYSLYANITIQIKPLSMNAEIELNASGNRSYLYSDNALSTANSYDYSATLQLRKNKQKAYNLSFVIGPSFSFNRFSLQQYDGNTNGFYSDAWATVFLPAGFELNTSYNYNYRGPAQGIGEQSRFIWNTAISKTFTKTSALKLSVNANDLLNQNINFGRSVTANAISQNSYNGIRRNGLLTLSWDFNKFAAAEKN